MKECTVKDKLNNVKNMKYSVLMTVYSGADPNHFYQAVKSMICQTIIPEQIVISVDGKLTKSLEKIICYYKNKYKNIITVVRGPKKGNWYAANKGIKECRNEFIARMDSDDISCSMRCERELFELLSKKLDIVGSFASEFENDTNNIISVRRVPLKHSEIVKYAKKRNPFNHPSIMFRKHMAVKAGSYSSMKRCEDYDFAVKMIMSGAKCGNIPECLLFYRLTKGTFNRRKNFNNTKGFIYVRFLNWRRGFCSFWDFLSISALQTALFITPVCVTEIFYNRILRGKQK